MTVRGPHFGFPGLCDLGNGELLMFARDGTSHAGYATAIRSWRTLDGDDPTPTWTQDADVVLHSYPSGNDWRDTCATVTSTGTIIVTMFCAGRAFCCRSTDRGHTWSDPIRLGSAPGVDAFGPSGRSAVSGPVIEPVPGSLLVALYGADVRKVKPSQTTTTTEPDPRQLASIRVVSSRDDGLTWGSSTLVANGTADGVSYQESNLCVLDTGEIYCMHRLGTDRRSYSVSTDGGSSWSPSVALPMAKVSGRPSTIQCTDPSRTMLHVYRPADQPHLAMYVASTDRGRTWGKPGVLTPGAGSVTPGPGGYFVYAQLVETAPGDVAVAFSVESNPKAPNTIDGAAYLFFDRIRAST